MIDSPMGFIRLPKPLHISYKAPNELLSIIKNDHRVALWIEQYGCVHGKEPNSSEILRYALCIFAFNILNPSDNELLQKNQNARQTN